MTASLREERTVLLGQFFFGPVEALELEIVACDLYDSSEVNSCIWKPCETSAARAGHKIWSGF